MTLISSVLSFPSGATVSNAVALPSNTAGLALFFPATTGGQTNVYVQLSPDGGTTWYTYAPYVAGSTVSISGVSLLGGNTSLRLFTTAATTSAFTTIYRYRTEETLNSSFLLT